MPAELDITDQQRIDFIAQQIVEHGPELYAVDAPNVNGADYWLWAPGPTRHVGATFREAIDNAILGKHTPLERAST